MADIFGLDGDDLLITGTNSADLIYGASDDDQTDPGNDTIDGLNGDDIIFGGAGDDQISGGRNQDEIFGGDGNDSIDGGSFGDTLFGGDGNDIIDGGTGNAGNTLFGGIGDDRLIVRDDLDSADGGAGRDILEFGVSLTVGQAFTFTNFEELASTDARLTMAADLASLDLSFIEVNNLTFTNGSGDEGASIRGRNDSANGDSIIGTQDDDFIAARNGDDTIDGGLGDDTITGGNGNDVLTAGDLDGTQSDELRGGQNDDLLNLGVLNIGDSVEGGNGTDTLTLTLADFAGINRLKVTNETLELNQNTANPIGAVGLEAYDITGTGGNDWLFISNGNSNPDAITFDAGAGTADRVFFEFTSANFAVTATINDDGTSSAAVAQTGGAFAQTYSFAGVEGIITSLGDDSLTGSVNRDVFNGGGGSDTIEGGGGNDILAGGSESDLFIFGLGSGRDTLNDFEFGIGGDVLDVSAYGFSSLAQVQAAISGSQLNLSTTDKIFFKNGVTAADLTVDNIVTGTGSVIQTVDGTTGNDMIRLPAGDYLVDGDTGTDTLLLLSTSAITVAMDPGTAGSGTATFDGGATATFTAIENITTGSGADSIQGDDQRNVLRAGDGDDIVNGGGGNDIFIGDGGIDTFVFEAGSGRDVLNDFEDGTDLLDVSGFGTFSGIADFERIVEGTNGVTVKFTADDSIFLKNITEAQIGDDDFVFVVA